MYLVKNIKKSKKIEKYFIRSEKALTCKKTHTLKKYTIF